MRRRVVRGKRVLGGSAERQKQSHARALAFLALDQELTPAWASTMRCTIGKPRPVPLGRVVKNGVQGAFSHLGVHAVPLIFDLNRDRGATGERCTRDHDVHAPALAHRLTSVLDQVVEDEPKQVRVDQTV